MFPFVSHWLEIAAANAAGEKKGTDVSVTIGYLITVS
jgi:hypothetical protein